MELRQLKTFHVVAECLNLTKAAEILRYSQPTITLQIQALERDIGHTLLNRVGKRTFLTPTGKLLKKHTDRLFQNLEELEQDLRRLEKPIGKLIVAAPEFYCSYYVSQLLSIYLNLHPQVQMKLLCYNSKETIKLVEANQADIGIVAGKCNRSGIEDEIHCKPTASIECGSEEAIKRAVLSQTGIALISDVIIEEEVKQGSLQILHRFPKRLLTHLIYPKDQREFSTVSSFIDVVLDVWPTFRV
ncbi:LysR family transcriptional regulator [Brevibacillus nitrificans]|uniref:LysR family transcriptional regulator n=1 Tax=Brevibacillus nitrificans TaxID=651560 RepID=UPI0028573663|nr:LysR family transcriptional regulator [Brevibacillus nitrificans]MDR7316800.1 DNA-binding transcriptional LysR family regulator [Brevibacillus nitrificans]